MVLCSAATFTGLSALSVWVAQELCAAAYNNYCASKVNLNMGLSLTSFYFPFRLSFYIYSMANNLSFSLKRVVTSRFEAMCAMTTIFISPMAILSPFTAQKLPLCQPSSIIMNLAKTSTVSITAVIVTERLNLKRQSFVRMLKVAKNWGNGFKSYTSHKNESITRGPQSIESVALPASTSFVAATNIGTQWVSALSEPERKWL